MANTTYGWIQGAQPKTYNKGGSTGERCLNSTDIIGAQPGTKNKGPFTWMDRRDVRQINRTDDIERCGPDTVTRGPKT